MNMHPIDWTIVAVMIGFLAFMAVFTRRYTRSVADFLAANRCAGRYLLTMAQGMAGMGAISIVANFEKFYQAGFAAGWWGQMLAPIGLILALSGWVVYRFRETNAMTMAQFYEMRYSRKFRVFAGILAWTSGIINYGIFPAVTGRFIIYFIGLPVHYAYIGPVELNITLGIVMAIMLSIAVTFTLLGGQIAVMITDFFQGQFVNITFVLIIFLLLAKFGWGTIIDTLKTAPENQSLLNPFKQGDLPDFNPWFFMMHAFVTVYGYMAWQGSQGYNCSAKSPHEARMSRILAEFRGGVTYLVIWMLPICAYVLLHNSDFLAQKEVVDATISTIHDTQIQKQMTVPVALTQILPVGLFGLFFASIISAAISTDDTYLHSWGSIFIQDVILPFRKKPLTPEAHMKWLKRSIIGVAVFGWLFSMLFPLREYILMFFAITGAIYIGGAGSVIIGGLYWKRGTTAGAWAGMITGSALAVSAIVVRNVLWPNVVPWMKEAYPHVQWITELPEKFFLNGMQMSFGASLIAMSAYVIVSLLTKPDPNFDMDKMLHRGKYAAEKTKDELARKQPNKVFRALGITDEFTFWDKFIYFFKIGWAGFFFLIFIVGTVIALTHETTEDQWAKWWLFKILFGAVMGTIFVIWFIIGGVHDMVHLFKTLRTAKRNVLDDGRVVGHQNLADLAEEELVPAPTEDESPLDVDTTVQGAEALRGDPADGDAPDKRT